MPDEPSRNGRQLPWKSAIRILMAIGLLAVVLLLGRQLADSIPVFTRWVDDLGMWAPVAFVVGYAIATVALVPASLLTLAAGAIFGLAKGTITVFIGATTGAALAFLVSRHLARETVQRRLADRFRFEAIDRACARQGFRIVLLLRLSPVFPFNLLNYALGLTRVRFIDYLAASIGMLPASFLYVYYGTALGKIAGAAGSGQTDRGIGYWLVLATGLVATVAVTAVVTRVARRALAQEIKDVQVHR
jgi:uncharacterized membrane protein YdjX (TVP38/TMEM64 family)